MSNNNAALGVANTALFQDEASIFTSPVAINKTGLIHVYAPEGEVTRVRDALRHAGILFTLNQYTVREPSGCCFCVYRPRALNERQTAFLQQMAQSGGHVEPLLDYLERRTQQVEVTLLDSDYLADNDWAQYVQQSGRVKPILDRVLAGLLLLITLPLWVLAALAIKCESAGSIFFRQKRTGLFNKEFDIIKFRSMCEDAEKDGAQWASKNDARITRVGAILRKTRIDELPQLLNVLCGEMALVGPRPEREVFIRDLEQHVPYYRFRHWVKPGVTGLAQVRYGYGASVADAMQKHRHDLYYIKHQSVWLDVKILLQTVRIVLTGQGV